MTALMISVVVIVTLLPMVLMLSPPTRYRKCLVSSFVGVSIQLLPLHPAHCIDTETAATTTTHVSTAVSSVLDTASVSASVSPKRVAFPTIATVSPVTTSSLDMAASGPISTSISISMNTADGDTVDQSQQRVWFEFSGRLTDTEEAIDELSQGINAIIKDLADSKMIFTLVLFVLTLGFIYRMDESETRMVQRMDESETRMVKRMDSADRRMTVMFIITSLISMAAVLVSVFKK